jgi:hypothetical protein
LRAHQPGRTMGRTAIERSMRINGRMLHVGKNAASVTKRPPGKTTHAQAPF